MGTGTDYNLPIGNLYYGIKHLNNDPSQDLWLTPRFGRVHITVKGIKQIKDVWKNLYFTISTAYKGCDFYGKPLKGVARVKSKGIISGNGLDFVMPQPLNFSLYPYRYALNEIIRISVHSVSESYPIMKIISDINEELIKFHAGQTTNVLIDLNTETPVVNIRLTDGDKIEQWGG